ncbi:MAG TPA: SRPBCC domain-containing protein [Dongiaceae bacterium]
MPNQAANDSATQARPVNPEKTTLNVTRHFKAPPALVYQAWTDPKKIVHWFGPDAGPVLSAEADVCVGGRYRVVFCTENGDEHDVSGLYREVVPNEKLVFTWSWRTTAERVSLVTVTMKAEGDGTLFSLTHEKLFDEETRDSHLYGWTGCIDKLGRWLEAA